MFSPAQLRREIENTGASRPPLAIDCATATPPPPKPPSSPRGTLTVVVVAQELPRPTGRAVDRRNSRASPPTRPVPPDRFGTLRSRCAYQSPFRGGKCVESLVRPHSLTTARRPGCPGCPPRAPQARRVRPNDVRRATPRFRARRTPAAVRGNSGNTAGCEAPGGCGPT